MEHHLEFLSFKGGCTGSSESTHFKMPYCWKSHVVAQMIFQKLGLEKVSIVGWSDGGIAGMIAAARYPEMVQNLVIWGANAYITQKDMDTYNSKLLK